MFSDDTHEYLRIAGGKPAIVCQVLASGPALHFTGVSTLTVFHDNVQDYHGQVKISGKRLFFQLRENSRIKYLNQSYEKQL